MVSVVCVYTKCNSIKNGAVVCVYTSWDSIKKDVRCMCFRIQQAKTPLCIQAINKHILHSLYINTLTYQQINYLHYKYIYISTIPLYVYTKRKREGAY